MAFEHCVGLGRLHFPKKVSRSMVEKMNRMQHDILQAANVIYYSCLNIRAHFSGLLSPVDEVYLEEKLSRMERQVDRLIIIAKVMEFSENFKVQDRDL